MLIDWCSARNNITSILGESDRLPVVMVGVPENVGSFFKSSCQADLKLLRTIKAEEQTEVDAAPDTIPPQAPLLTLRGRISTEQVPPFSAK